jgi:hypothetical protein
MFHQGQAAFGVGYSASGSENLEISGYTALVIHLEQNERGISTLLILDFCY